MKQEKVRDTLSRLSKGLFRILSETTVHSIATIILEHPANQLVQIESEDTNGLEKKKKKRNNNLREEEAGLAKLQYYIMENRETYDVCSNSKSRSD